MRGCRALLPTLLCLIAAGPSTLPSDPPGGLNAELWQKMKAIDARAAAIEDLTADFEQEKFTPLLKKPMLSRGQVVSRGPVALWTTAVPEPTVMRVEPTQISIYYPNQKTVEVFPIEQRLADLVSSPVPALSELLAHFSFAPASADAFADQPEPGALALKMTPTDSHMREHLQSADVLLDEQRGVIRALRLIDPDGDRTEMRFSNVRINSKLDASQVRLQLPADVKVVHPLDAAPATGGSQ